MIGIRSIVPAALVFMFAGPAAADALTDAARGLCDTVKSCALEQVAQQDVTPEILSMMEPMLEQMCASMRSQVQEVPAGHPLYQPAVGCMRSLESLSCEQMQDPEVVSTPECEEYEKLAKEAGAVKE